jgi:hypothetical protein
MLKKQSKLSMCNPARCCLIGILQAACILPIQGASLKTLTETSPISSKRDRLRQVIGAIDSLQPPTPLQVLTSSSTRTNLAETEAFTAFAVRWPVFEKVTGEGLLLLPRRPPVARVVAIPDSGESPEQLAGLASGLVPERQFAKRLAEHGCEVLVPLLVNSDEVAPPLPIHNCSNDLSRREWLCRLGYPFGRHILGLEVEKVLAGLNCLECLDRAGSPPPGAQAAAHFPTGLVGYADGGFLAFYCAALEPSIDVVLLSGSFGSHPHPWEEATTRQVFGLLPEFADTQLATLVAPRTLLVEHSPPPDSQRPGSPTPDFEAVESEFAHARKLVEPTAPQVLDKWQLFSGTEGMTTGPASDRALVAFLKELRLSLDELKPPARAPNDPRPAEMLAQRQQRQFKELADFLQGLAKTPSP